MAEELIALRWDLAAPFQIALGGEPCRIEEIHRLLPGKRLAARGRFQGREVLVKLFVGWGSRRRCRRERQGLAHLRANGLNAPQLLREAPVARPRGWALLFEFLAEARPIASAPSALAEAEAGLAAEALARLHGCGAAHRDPHRSNFLVASGKLHLVDGDGIRKCSASLGERRSLKALATFLAQYPPMEDDRMAALLELYVQRRGWPADPARLRRLRKLALAARRRRLRRYLGKTQRDCTKFRCERSWHWVCLAMRCCWNGALRDFAADPEAGLAGAQRVAQDGGATLFRLSIGGVQMMVRRCGAGNAGRGTRWRFHSPLRTAWREGHRANFLAPATPPPIALIERRWGPLRGRCYLLLRWRAGAQA